MSVKWGERDAGRLYCTSPHAYPVGIVRRVKRSMDRRWKRQEKWVGTVISGRMDGGTIVYQGPDLDAAKAACEKAMKGTGDGQ